jgi:hypothetical protein
MQDVVTKRIVDILAAFPITPYARPPRLVLVHSSIAIVACCGVEYFLACTIPSADENETCVVCIDEFEAGAPSRRLHCNVIPNFHGIVCYSSSLISFSLLLAAAPTDSMCSMQRASTPGSKPSTRAHCASVISLMVKRRIFPYIARLWSTT